MWWLILICLGVFTLERLWLLKDVLSGRPAANCLEGLGLFVMALLALAATLGHLLAR